ncbi:hypothetical protein K466DRAFT_631972 [Polyporus arcularius HHB13444]|uniref:BTB domain-containing protein n=1 Tax=Polyporus arcularius HHB13444 TaxID=1314778 RepID=A0A5C3NYN1_9APHY|nr:hypothetical protein K466DRAFT_631972 [Polyporus arcularius HHB13444]
MPTKAVAFRTISVLVSILQVPPLAKMAETARSSKAKKRSPLKTKKTLSEILKGLEQERLTLSGEAGGLGQMTLTSSELAVRTASAPFNDPSADAVLRTSDNVEFRVFRWFLKAISPLFDDMFALPQPPGSTSTSPILMSEPSSVLEVLLRLYYPFPEMPTFSSFCDAKPVLAAAHKLQLTRIEPILNDAALPYISKDPLRAYGFALRHGMEDLARLAAREFLTVTDFSVRKSDELEGLSVGAYRRLLIYRQSCIDQIEKDADLLWGRRPGQSGNTWTWYSCPTCVHHQLDCGCRSGLSSSTRVCESDCGTAGWFFDYTQRVKHSLRVTPSVAVVNDPAFISDSLAKAYQNCQSSCRRLAYEHMQRYTGELAGDLEICISKVRESLLRFASATNAGCILVGAVGNTVTM